MILLSITLISSPIMHQQTGFRGLPKINAPPLPSVVGILPSNISGSGPQLTPGGGHQAIFAINLTNYPPIHAFTVQLQYNHAVVQVAPGGVDLSGGVLSTGGGVQIFSECVDDVPVVPPCQTSLDNTGVVTLAAAIVGPNNSTTSKSLLFTIAFNIVAVGVSQIHLLNAVIVQGSPIGQAGAKLDVQMADGYFSNVLCGSQLCVPPVTNFFMSPAPPIRVSTPVQFDATGSHTTNSGAKIEAYNWFWDSPDLPGFATRKPVINQTFYTATQEDFITLTVNDTDHAIGYFTMKVQVTHITLDLKVSSIVTDKSFRVIPGTPVNITAIGENDSSNSQNVTMAITVDGKVLINRTFINIMNHRETPPLIYTWDTAGYAPRMYEVAASIPFLRDLNGRIIEDDTSNNRLSTFVQLVDSLGPTNVRLSLLQITGLGVIVLIGIGVAAALVFRRRSSVEPAPL
jgi:hypothetical protein